MEEDKNLESQEENSVEENNEDVIADEELEQPTEENTIPQQTTSYSSAVSRKPSFGSAVKGTISPPKKIQTGGYRTNRPIHLPRRTNGQSIGTNLNGNSGGTNSFLSKISSLSNESKDSADKKSRGIFGTNNNNKDKIKGSGAIDAVWKELPLKTKLIIIAIAVAASISAIFMVVLITPLITQGYIDIGGSASSGGASTTGDYTSITSSNSHWFPIGSSDTTVIGGKKFARGTPYTTNLTSYFSAQEDFRTKGHGGIDVGNAGNGPGVINVIATKDGKVIYPTSSSQTSYEDNGYYGNKDGDGFGNYVKIQHNDGTSTIYAHLSKNSITVLAGETVKQGQVIGKMGHSGSSTGTHLHFEVRVNGNRVDPLNYVSINNPRPESSKPMFVNGDSNQQSVCLTLRNTGFSDDAVAAIMTNMYYESSFDPTNVGDNGTSYGLCQWHNDRYDNLITSFPSTYPTIESQIEFLMYELENDHIEVFNYLNNEGNSHGDLTYNFCSNFEKPKDTEKTCKERSQLSQTFYAYVSNNCQ